MIQFPPIEFLTSAWRPDQFPPDQGSEVAFAGRSNAGKSSAINAIAGRRNLARTSKTPGRTQLINFFSLPGQTRLADLPGYGYAKVPPEMQRHWRALLSRYIEQRRSLAGVVIVMDARRPLTDFDWQMLQWVDARGLACHLLMTKADKLNRNDTVRTLRNVRTETQDIATCQMFSAVAKTGLSEARQAVIGMLAGEAAGQRAGVSSDDSGPG